MTRLDQRSYVGPYGELLGREPVWHLAKLPDQASQQARVRTWLLPFAALVILAAADALVRSAGVGLGWIRTGRGLKCQQTNAPERCPHEHAAASG